MHTKKSKIIHCKNGRRKKDYPTTRCDFFWHTVCKRRIGNPKNGYVFSGFKPAVSKAICEENRRKNFRNRTENSILVMQERKKYKKRTYHKIRAYHFIGRISEREADGVIRSSDSPPKVNFYICFLKLVVKKIRKISHIIPKT